MSEKKLKPVGESESVSKTHPVPDGIKSQLVHLSNSRQLIAAQERALLEKLLRVSGIQGDDPQIKFSPDLSVFIVDDEEDRS